MELAPEDGTIKLIVAELISNGAFVTSPGNLLFVSSKKPLNLDLERNYDVCRAVLQHAGQLPPSKLAVAIGMAAGVLKRAGDYALEAHGLHRFLLLIWIEFVVGFEAAFAVSGQLQSSFKANKAVSRHLQSSLKASGSFKAVPKPLQSRFQAVAKQVPSQFKAVSNQFQSSFKAVSEPVQGSFKAVSKHGSTRTSHVPADNMD